MGCRLEDWGDLLQPALRGQVGMGESPREARTAPPCHRLRLCVHPSRPATYSSPCRVDLDEVELTRSICTGDCPVLRLLRTQKGARMLLRR